MQENHVLCLVQGEEVFLELLIELQTDTQVPVGCPPKKRNFFGSKPSIDQLSYCMFWYH